MNLPTCCDFHGKGEHGCRQGRECPTPQACELPDASDPYQILPAWTIFAGVLVMTMLAGFAWAMR
jgi:hypothetical protein